MSDFATSTAKMPVAVAATAASEIPVTMAATVSTAMVPIDAATNAANLQVAWGAN